VLANWNLRDEKPLAEIITDLQSGKGATENFRLVFERYYAPIVRLFERNGLMTEDAKDLAQDVFLAAHRSIAELKNATQFPSWLFSIARNALLNHIEGRRAKKRFGLEVAPGPDSPDEGKAIVENLPDRTRHSDALGQILDREKFEALLAALRELPSQMRRCVHLRVVEESTYNEIAVTMGLSINTVKAHLHQARKALKEKLHPYFRDLEV
jgi:RNA polymerase sigma-70 factor, ECF subfamily